MKDKDIIDIEKEVDAMMTKKNIPLIIVFVVLIILSILFTSGALSVTVDSSKFSQAGWERGISWLWMPALLFFVLSVLTAWALFIKKKIWK